MQLVRIGGDMETQNIIVYPVLISKLGGASKVRLGKMSAFVTIPGMEEIRLPRSEVQLYLDDGIKLAEVVKAWAYRNK
jgi:hypothetical protein